MDNSRNNPLLTAETLAEHTGVNIFLTGKAGTGKTTFLRRLRESTSKRMIVLAPTGVAAINAGGVTIHSFFQLSFAPFIPGKGFIGEEKRRFSFNKTKWRIIRTLDLLVIDEISMVRPDVLDAIDDVMRRFRDPMRPFGGVQLLLIGDLRQLAPVAQENEWQHLAPYYNSPYFFESKALNMAGFVTVELTVVFRQQDVRFVNLLNKIRDNRAEVADLELLNRRAICRPDNETEGIIRLTTHNAAADRINEANLQNLQTREQIYTAKIEGDFPSSSFPAEQFLRLKVGAQVMFIKNDPEGAYYNGLIATVANLSDYAVTVTTRDDDPRDITVSATDWENTKYALDEKSGQIHEVTEGVFSQIPLRLAWAITIHKSQGLTFEKAVIDASRSFAPGQTYVALSRCRSLEGLYLERPLPPSAIITDNCVSDFIRRQTGLSPDNVAVERFKQKYYVDTLLELFDFSGLGRALEAFHRVAVTDAAGAYPQFATETDRARDTARRDILSVAEKFQTLIPRLLTRGDEESLANLKQKIAGGAKYFEALLRKLHNFLIMAPDEFDNKATAKRFRLAADEFSEQVMIKQSLMLLFADTPFSTEAYIQEKARVLLKFDSQAPAAKAKKRHAPKIKLTEATEENVVNAPLTDDSLSLFNKLRQWRKEEADKIGRPAFCIAYDRALQEICEVMPRDIDTLAAISSFGHSRAERYGERLLEIINSETTV